MKNILLAMSLLVGGVAFAQQDLQEQINQLRMEIDQLRMAPPPPPINMPVPPEEMESPLRKKFNMYFNFQTSLDAERIGENDLTTKFQARQLRLEVRGDLNERIFYRFRHRLNKPNAAASLDNLAKATDLLYAGFRLNEKWSATVGKMCQAWGGYEFDLNPMNIYEYSDFLNIDNFMLGAMITYAPNPNHEFNLQITDVRNSNFADLYATATATATIKESNTPLAYIFNWNGNLFDSVIQTRWGAGLQSEADGYTNTLVMLGTKLNLPKFQVSLDYMMANDQLDRLNYTPLSNNGSATPVKDAKYNSFVLKAEYQPAPEWNIFAQGLYETANSSLANNEFKGIGYFAGVEYLPFKEQDLRFFLAYIGRSRDKNSAVENTNRVSVGMMYRIKAF